jgi:uncharacterized protein YjgD (DUF1641 family)
MSDSATAKAQTSEEMQRLFGVVTESLTDGMVERAASTASNLLEVADHISEPDTRAAIHFVLDELTMLHRTGALASVFELVLLFNGLKNATTDGIVERGSMFIEKMVSNLSSEEFEDLMANAGEAMHEAAEETAGVRHPGGLFSTLALLKKPETQASLHFLLTFAQKLQAKTG